MTNSIPPLSQWTTPTTPVSNSAAAPVAGASSNASGSFNDVLSAMMMAGSQSSTSGTGTDTSSMLLPLVLGLLEKLLEQTSASTATPAAATGSTAAAPTPAAAAMATPVTAPAAASTNGGATPSGRPVGGVVTNTFHPGHNGIDFGVPIGTNVQATMSGKVIYAGWNDQGYGNLVIVENGPYRTYFAHLSKVPVKLGQEVTAGSVVGISGSTGNSTGPHVHYEVRYNLKVIDPTSFTLKAGKS